MNAENENKKKPKREAPVWVALGVTVGFGAVLLAYVVFARLSHTPQVGVADTNLGIDVVLMAAAISTIILVLFGVLSFTKSREMQEEYREMRRLHERAEDLSDRRRMDMDKAINEVRHKAEEAITEVEHRANKANAEVERRANETIVKVEQSVQKEEKRTADRRRAEEYLRDGQRKHEARDFIGAIAALKEAIRSDRSHAEAHRLLGNCYLSISPKPKDRCPDAIAVLTTAIELRGDYAQAYLDRGNTCAAMGIWEKAVKDYERVNGLESMGWPQAWVLRLVGLSKLGLFDERREAHVAMDRACRQHLGWWSHAGEVFAHRSNDAETLLLRFAESDKDRDVFSCAAHYYIAADCFHRAQITSEREQLLQQYETKLQEFVTTGESNSATHIIEYKLAERELEIIKMEGVRA